MSAFFRNMLQGTGAQILGGLRSARLLLGGVQMRKATRGTTSTSITIGSIIVDFIMEAADSGGVATVFECIVAAGDQMPPPHSHDAFDETIYGLDGVFQ